MKLHTAYGDFDLDTIARAVSQIESSGGKQVGPRYEPTFQRRYLEGKQPWESLAQKYGWEAVSSSYGAHQVLFPVAYELGYRGDPAGLADSAVNRAYFDKKFLKEWKRSGGDLSKTLQSYNGGGQPDYSSHVIFHLTHPSHPTTIQEGTTMTNPTTPNEPPTHRLIRHFNQMSQAVGFGPLTVEEVHGLLRKMTPPPAINGADPNEYLGLPPGGSRVFGEDALQSEGFSFQHPLLRGLQPRQNPLGLVEGTI